MEKVLEYHGNQYISIDHYSKTFSTVV